jgi:hypothetical protein
MFSLQKRLISRRMVLASMLILAVSILLPNPHAHSAPLEVEHSSKYDNDHGAGSHGHEQHQSDNSSNFCCHNAMSGCSGLIWVNSDLGNLIVFGGTDLIANSVAHLVERSDPPTHRPPRLPS